MRGDANEPVRYPTNHLLGIVDTRDQLNALVSALGSEGFRESEIEFRTGVENADTLQASTGRTGLPGLLLRFAERIGAADEEQAHARVHRPTRQALIALQTRHARAGRRGAPRR